MNALNDRVRPHPLHLGKAVPDDGYHWWYLDAISDDGVHALTVIVFVGSVFSPYYASARQRRSTPAANHCAFNVALYGPRGCWAMTERSARHLHRDASAFELGPSRLAVNNQPTGVSKQLVYDLDEIAMPWLRRMRGQLIIDLPNFTPIPSALDAEQLHWWQPLAPCTRISVDMHKPDISWQGTAYVDNNWGAIPLEQSFQQWNWSRAHPGDGSTHLHYDIVDRTGERHSHSHVIDSSGQQISCDIHCQQLPKTRWFRVPRQAMTQGPGYVQSLQTLEDTPFYSRSRFGFKPDSAATDTAPIQVMHESLDLNRFTSPITQCLLPFRMPRRA